MTSPIQRSETALDNASPFIRKLDRLASLSTQDKAALAAVSSATRTIEQGVDLPSAKDAADGAFLILDGYACRYMLREDGSRQITCYLVPGDHCDTGSVLGVSHPLGTLSPCRVAFVARSVFNDMTKESAPIAEALRISALIDEATLREWLMNIGRRTSEERLSHLFCELLTRLRAVDLVDGNSVRFPLTQFDLGDTMGLSYVHVNRTLQSLRQQELITLRGKVLSILDLPRLVALAEFKPGYLALAHA